MKTSKVDRMKGLPWLLLLQAAVVLGKHWSALSPKDRASLARLVRQSKGRAGNLSVRERRELGRLSRKLDVQGASRELLPLIRPGRKRR